MSKAYVLDASALLALVDNSRGADRMERLLREAVHRNAPLLMSVVNWGEVFYHLWERHGEESDAYN